MRGIESSYVNTYWSGVDLDTYFSDVFEISKKSLDDYGAFSISLATDLPLFIDPFLLFHTQKW